MEHRYPCVIGDGRRVALIDTPTGEVIRVYDEVDAVIHDLPSPSPRPGASVYISDCAF